MDELFNFEGYNVRFVGTWENPEWIAQDICDVLEIANVSQALEDFDDDEKGISNTYTLGGSQSMLTLKEAGLYKLLFRSRKPIAKRFTKWVTNEVLPSIRKKGYYKAKTNCYWYKRVQLAMSSTIRPLPRGYFCIYLRMMELFRQLEERFDYIFPDTDSETGKYIIPDISIGRMFNEFMRSDSDVAKHKRLEYLGSEEVIDFRSPNGKNYNEIDVYQHIYPKESHNDRNIAEAKAYPNKYSSIFDYYFEFHWIPDRFNDYLKERDLQGYQDLQNKINALTSGDRSVLKSTILHGVIQKFLES